MWLLECDGDTFRGKKLWLRPGRKLLLGRTPNRSENPPGGNLVIHNKSVSKKHAIISVSQVRPGDGTRPSTRSEITITDDSKIGTFVDDETVHNQSRTLTNELHRIKLGRFEQTFTITWRPIVFTFSFGNKKEKNDEDRLEPFKARLEPLDIKTIYPYLIDSTTHVVASRRNTIKGLQALVNAKYIVTERYFDAISSAALSPGPDDDGEMPRWSPLELDFEANWPDPLNYLPGPGKEPNPRPPEHFAPDPDRINVFDGFTFVIGNAKQHGLVDPITNGSAKCLLYTVQMGETSTQEFVNYVKTAGGKKPGESFVPGTGKGVVVVRLNREGETADWAAQFCKDVDQELGQRSIEQNEFLDAILLNDATHLRRPLEEDDGEGVTGPPSTAATSKERGRRTEDAAADSKDSAAINSESGPKPRSRFKSRQIVTSQFKGFDYFDTNSAPISRRPQPRAVMEEDEAIHHRASQKDSESLFVKESRRSKSPKGNLLEQSSRKRDEPEDGHDDMIGDALFPGATAMKKQRLEEAKANVENQKPPMRRLPAEAMEESHDMRKGSKATQKEKEKEIDVRSAARSYVQDLNKRGQASDSQMVDMLSDPEGVSGLRNLAIIEEIDVPASREEFLAQWRQCPVEDGIAQPGGTHSAPRNAWNDAWNGRRNFKRFRRKGQPVANRGHKVIVPLEEAKQKDFGIGDDYWLEDGGGEKTDRARQTSNRDEASQHHNRRPIGRSNPIVIDDEGERRSRRSASQESSTSMLQDEQAQHIARPQANTRPSRKQREPTTQPSRTGVKRPAAADEEDGRASQVSFRASKRAKYGFATSRKNKLGVDRDNGVAASSNSDEDDEDGLRFKLNKRKGLRTGK